MFVYNQNVRFKVIKDTKPYLKCRVSIKADTPLIKVNQKLEIHDIKNKKSINVRVISVVYNTMSHLTKKKQNVTGRCILQVLK